jgi:hypothetical protein
MRKEIATKFDWEGLSATAIGVIATLLAVGMIGGIVPYTAIDWRIGTLILLVLGAATLFILGSRSIPERGVWNIVGMSLTILTILVGISNLTLNNIYLFTILFVSLIIIWTIAIVSHFTTKKK